MLSNVIEVDDLMPSGKLSALSKAQTYLISLETGAEVHVGNKSQKHKS